MVFIPYISQLLCFQIIHGAIICLSKSAIVSKIECIKYLWSSLLPCIFDKCQRAADVSTVLMTNQLPHYFASPYFSTHYASDDDCLRLFAVEALFYQRRFFSLSFYIFYFSGG